ncbi:hypothetical protein N7471_007068 [Penicillium samsonianum]|uniref:uncharacterized protein n=1 Tax=Penicillium samsonianum TaxID=1882272 RepID=UPI0025468EE7|nr:uncharacterized protein N7471_007068 [Penicillium samsonianum]KAJ6131853.1 hypothetical protein N7471_007068 [Penicillium samsonianum]
MEDSIELVAAEADGPLSRESRLKTGCLPWDGNKCFLRLFVKRTAEDRRYLLSAFCPATIASLTVEAKAVWLADLNGTRVIIKCWKPKLEELFDSEAAVYNRIWSQQPSGTLVLDPVNSLRRQRPRYVSTIRQSITISPAVALTTSDNPFWQPRAIFDLLWHGQPAMAKCWTPSEFQSHLNEMITYQILREKRPKRYSFFPSPYAAGVIRCSSVFLYGYILVLAKKEFVYQQVLAAVKVLRAVGIVWVDLVHIMCFNTRTTMSLLCLW